MKQIPKCAAFSAVICAISIMSYSAGFSVGKLDGHLTSKSILQALHRQATKGSDPEATIKQIAFNTDYLMREEAIVFAELESRCIKVPFSLLLDRTSRGELDSFVATYGQTSGSDPDNKASNVERTLGEK